MVIFNSYVKLPEGKPWENHGNTMEKKKYKNYK